MLKVAFAVGALGLAFVTPSYSQTMTCDEATMTKMKTDIDAMTDKEKQAGYMKDYDAAMALMKANKMDECNAAVNGTASKMNNDAQGSKSTTTN
jgi:hypothetical protein